MNIYNITFGNYVRQLRLDYVLGLREFARRLEISPSYLNDVEKQRWVAPKAIVVSKIAKLLNADDKYIMDLASQSRKDIVADISDMVQDSLETVKLTKSNPRFSFKWRKNKKYKRFLNVNEH